MRISTNIKRPDNWYQGTRIVITDSYYNRLMRYEPYFSTNYNTKLGRNDLSNNVLHVDLVDNYIKTYLDSDPNYKIIVYALTYDGVIDITHDEKQTYYKYINNEVVESLFDDDVCIPNNGSPIDNHERNFIQRNIRINNAAYNKYYKFEITPELVNTNDSNISTTTTDDEINTNPSTQQNVKYDDIELYFTYIYSGCDIDKFLNCAKESLSATDLINIDNTIIYDGSSEFVISNDGENSSANSETDENTKADENDNNNVQMFGNVSKSKLDNQTVSYINYKSNRNSDYSPVLSLEAYDKDHTFLGWYKIHSTEPYILGITKIQFSSLFEGFVSSQKVATFDYNKLNELSDAEQYVYFFAVYSTQQNEIIPFENRKMRIMKVY